MLSQVIKSRGFSLETNESSNQSRQKSLVANGGVVSGLRPSRMRTDQGKASIHFQEVYLGGGGLAPGHWLLESWSLRKKLFRFLFQPVQDMGNTG